MNWKCFFSFHVWHYTDLGRRRCLRCSEAQHREDGCWMITPRGAR